jgi:hypothetical protein
MSVKQKIPIRGEMKIMATGHEQLIIGKVSSPHSIAKQTGPDESYFAASWASPSSRPISSSLFSMVASPKSQPRKTAYEVADEVGGALVTKPEQTTSFFTVMGIIRFFIDWNKVRCVTLVTSGPVPFLPLHRSRRSDRYGRRS